VALSAHIQMEEILIGRLTLAALAFTCFAATAEAQNLGGDYSVEGTNLNGSPYSGDARITVISETTCTIEWVTGGTTSSGFCMRNDDAFAAGYVMGDAIGLIIYKMEDGGVLKGLWTITGKDGVGTEVLTPK
jgi:hypothetical protein